ncbi:sucrase ferredoxin [Microlunatus aurantiacus]|uniref:Sucrase ferredoxin n=1 Tax=Microlunatus aurantiacus TaxID=446786 RepID=A0ABP7CPD8_9ACTN
MTTPTFRCADAARERRDPPVGTAPLASSFLLIEHPGPWRFDALTGAGWSTEVVAALTAAIRASRSRLLLIRRPGRRVPSDRRSWAVTRVGGTTTWGSWRREDDLLVAADTLAGASSAAGAVSEDPLLLVCAHGQHDTCCALRGRPVAAALAAHWPEATWECSHVGGDRFAANLVTLPDGTYYGDLDAGSAVDVVRGHLDGRLAANHLRGSVRWPPPAQAAIGEIHRRHGPYGPGDVRADGWSTPEPGRWRVAASASDGRRWQVEVWSRRREAARLTCAATQDTFAMTYEVAGVEAMDPVGR